ncbi:MAG: aminopeptidase [Clostridioides sp.]|jgi:aminopeptidase|nr:aminopeptidase [Clostridioides sp.]
MESFQRNLQKLAELAVTTGVNIQPNQELEISSNISNAELVRLITKEAYKRGAKNVHINWADEESSLIKYLNAPEEVFDEFPEWNTLMFNELAKRGAAFLSIVSNNPDLLKDVDPKRVAASRKSSGEALKEWRKYMNTDKCRWSIIAAASPAWAKKVFPDLDEKEAVDKLWEEIFKCSRVTGENPTEDWNKHNNLIHEKVTFLNEMNFKTLKFKSKITDLEIGLVEGHIWLGGCSDDPNGIRFNANIPTEEVFGMPHKFKVNGTVHNTKPLVYAGNTIDNFSITFKDGKIVDFSAEKGYEVLKNLIETDEGSLYLGEVAFVPYDSPISNSNTVFYSTLFDENASCHLAIGSAYSTNIENGPEISEDDYDKFGINKSITHVDFMFGSEDMNIVGVKEDGSEIDIFINGNWA